MNKVRFLAILERCRSSGLSVSAFCGNEGYAVSSFYYWRRKFTESALEQPTATLTVPHTTGSGPCLAPVRICRQGAPLTKNATPVEKEERIRVELPGGVAVNFHFRGSTSAVLDFLTQLYHSHVLPQ